MRIGFLLVLSALTAAFATPVTRAAPAATPPVPEASTAQVTWCETDNDLPYAESSVGEGETFEGPANNGLIGIGGGAGGAFRSRGAHRRQPVRPSTECPIEP